MDDRKADMLYVQVAAVSDAEQRTLLKTISLARAACGWEPRG